VVEKLWQVETPIPIDANIKYVQMNKIEGKTIISVVYEIEEDEK